MEHREAGEAHPRAQDGVTSDGWTHMLRSFDSSARVCSNNALIKRAARLLIWFDALPRRSGSHSRRPAPYRYQATSLLSSFCRPFRCPVAFCLPVYLLAFPVCPTAIAQKELRRSLLKLLYLAGSTRMSEGRRGNAQYAGG